MTGEKPQSVYRKDYRPPDYWIDDVDLHFDLHEEETQVRARLTLRRNETLVGDVPPLVLHGEELELRSVSLDGRVLSPREYHVDARSLRIDAPPARFELETVVRIRPQENTQLSGLYRSGGIFCTQCEAHGFRRITWFLDRPDVMARFRVTIDAERERYPVLLSNGNRTGSEDRPDGRHRACWEDPFRKPAYLFALVAGDLHCQAGSFRTRSGRDVRLEIWVEPQNAERCEHALQALGKAMAWDEETFGLEYDLDVYMIVAVNDFNMGAMENKGLNVFNSKYVLALPETATDEEYEAIEAVIAHEYFHNWTGNRVTCRDWFQLTLKEGLTVFREQQFSADATSAAVKRIEDVRQLRVHQFPEDAGPMSHPVRPESYISMDNFYTATVYEKGAEVVRLYHTLLGAGGFRKGLERYFERHDGEAVTCDDFRAAMADANGQDLSRFAGWYAQSGTPRLEARGAHDAERGRYELTLEQHPGQPGETQEPLPIPVAVGLLDSDGRDLPLRVEGEEAGAAATTRLLLLEKKRQRFVFDDVPRPPVPSLLRGFSAPVQLDFARSPEELAFLMAHDSDAFNRWEAGQQLAQQVLLALVSRWGEPDPPSLPSYFVEAFGRLLADETLDGSQKALSLTLPAESLLGQALDTIDVDAVHGAREFAVTALARAHRAAFEKLYAREAAPGPYRFDREGVDRRRLANLCLRYLAGLGDPAITAEIERRFLEADNMTDRQVALRLLADLPGPERERSLQVFYECWRADPLVLDKWFGVQAQSSLPDTCERVRALSQQPDFSLANPNRVRALLGAFSMGNPLRFHGADGAGYKLVAENVLALDPRNPQLASRLVSAFNQWRRYDAARQALMQEQLAGIAAQQGLSDDVYEIVNRALAR